MSAKIAASSGAYVLAIGADGVHDPGSRVLVVIDIGNLTLEEISRRLADLA